MQNPEEFINSLPEIECEIATILHHEISAIPGVSSKNGCVIFHPKRKVALNCVL
jgi:hypothetical protein